MSERAGAGMPLPITSTPERRRWLPRRRRWLLLLAAATTAIGSLGFVRSVLFLIEN